MWFLRGWGKNGDGNAPNAIVSIRPRYITVPITILPAPIARISERRRKTAWRLCIRRWPRNGMRPKMRRLSRRMCCPVQIRAFGGNAKRAIAGGP